MGVTIPGSIWGRALAALLTVWLASCRTPPPPPVPWFEGEGKHLGVNPPPDDRVEVTAFVANFLIQSPESLGDGFGRAMALGNKTLAIAAPGAAGGGAVWIFDTASIKQAPTRLGTGGDADILGFGAAVSVSPSGQIVAVGAPESRVQGQAGAGAVLIWRLQGKTWTFVGRFLDDEPQAGSRFGAAVEVDEYNLVVGAPGAGTTELPEQGLAMAWVSKAPAKWMEPITIQAEKPTRGERFGTRISLMPGDALIASDPPSGAGPLALFRNRLGKWGDKPVAMLYPRRSSPLDGFGTSMSIYVDSRLRRPRDKDLASYDPGMMAVGSPGANTPAAADVGCVHLFEQNPRNRAWRERSKLLSPDPQAEAAFGSSVSISRDRLIVGAPGHDHGESSDSGSAYVFKSQLDRKTDELEWRATFELRPSEPANGGRFGSLVTGSDDCIAISEPGKERVHLFTRTEAGPGLPVPTPEGPTTASEAQNPAPARISSSSL